MFDVMFPPLTRQRLLLFYFLKSVVGTSTTSPSCHGGKSVSRRHQCVYVTVYFLKFPVASTPFRFVSRDNGIREGKLKH